jgi:hypothetical protein
MKIIEKSILKDGTEIQLEDWSEHNSEEYPDLYGLTIGAYPYAKRTGKYRWVEGGKRFRLSISNNKYMGYTDEMVKQDYNDLISGKKTLEDLSEHFYNGDKDKYYMGLECERMDY